MGVSDRFARLTTEYGRYVVAVFLVATLLIGSGATALEQQSSLDQFETESEAADKQEYIDEHFGTDDNTTSAQVFVRGGSALERESLLATLELQRAFRENETVNETLGDEPFEDLASIVATTAIRQEEAAQLEERQAQLETDREELEERGAQLEADREALNETAETLVGLLGDARETQAEYDQLNVSYERGEVDDGTYAAEADRLEGEFESVREEARAELNESQYGAFEPLVSQARSIQQTVFDAELAYERGEIDEETRDERVEEAESEFENVTAAVYREVLGEEFGALESRAAQLEADSQDLEERGEQLRAESEALQDPDRDAPPLDEQIDRLESMDDDEVEAVVSDLLSGEGSQGLYGFLPQDYESGSTEADARMLMVTQLSADSQAVQGEASDRIVDAQLAMADIVDDRVGDDGFVFGVGIITDEIDRSLGDSMAIVLPLALLFVTLVLTIAYRDLLDILLGLAGIALVLVWTFGFMGWTGVSFNQIMIAVPVLLVGLSIDYAIHLFMRHREHRTGDGNGTRSAMRVVLVGLGVAFVWVTATAVIGFLSNLISPVGPLREFGAASAFGITAALLVFGLFVPAAKVELDAALEARGYDRRKRAFGTGGGPVSGVLSIGQRVAGRVPWAAVVVAVLLTLGGAYGATQVDTSFQQEDFIADDPPAWTDSLPEPFAPGEYGAKENIDYVSRNFARQDMQAQLLVEGTVADDGIPDRLDRAEDGIADSGVAITLPDGEPDVRSPLTVMESVAAENESFNETLAAADTEGDDGVPDEDVEAVYDELFAVAPDRAGDVIHRVDGEYEAVRTVIPVQGEADSGEIKDRMDEVAADVDGDGVTATATGQTIVFHVVEQELFQTVLDSLAITLVAVFAFLMVTYRWVHGSAILGAVTLTPIVFAVAWILGTMYLLEIPFNVMTGTITSLTIGLGVAYNIHMTERYVLERERGHGTAESLRRSVTGTGGALLGSAATTIGGFGVLVFAILPPLQQFGTITGLTIAFAFAGSVFVLPSFLTLWTRYVGPRGGFPTEPAAEAEPAVTDGAGDGGTDDR